MDKRIPNLDHVANSLKGLWLLVQGIAFKTLIENAISPDAGDMWLILLLQTATAILFHVRWVFGNTSYIGDRYCVETGPPAAGWGRQFGGDLFLLTLHAIALIGMGADVRGPSFWNWVLLLLVSDTLWLAYDPDIRPRWLLWILEGYRKSFPPEASVVLPWRPSYPPRAWVTINLITAGLLGVTLAVPLQSGEASVAAFSAICLGNAIADWIATRWWVIH